MVLVLFLGQVAVVVYGFVEEDAIRDAIAKGMIETMDEYKTNSDDAKNALDKSQHSVSGITSLDKQVKSSLATSYSNTKCMIFML